MQAADAPAKNRRMLRRIAFASALILSSTGLVACEGCDPDGLDDVDAGNGPPLPVDDDDDAGFVVDPPGCLEGMGDADKERVVLVGHPFAADAGVDGTDLRSMTLQADGALVDDGMRLDVGFRTNRIEFVPSGTIALVLGEDGELASVGVKGALDLEVVDEVQLPSAGYGDLRVAPSGDVVYVVGTNSTETGGISVVDVGCDGALTVREDAFVPLRLTHALVLLDDGRALVIGGQATFDPAATDLDDTRLFDLRDGAPSEVAKVDLWSDFIDVARIDASPDGRFALVPNQSPFSAEGGKAMTLSIDGDVVESRGFLDLPAATEAVFSPDGTRALVSQFDEDKVSIVFIDDDGDFSVTGAVTGIGLADQMATVRRGTNAGLVLVTSVDQSGNIALLKFDDAAGALDLGQTALGEGSPDIPGAIAVQP